jgi:transposase
MKTQVVRGDSQQKVAEMIEYLSTRGGKGATVDEICEAIGRSRVSVYIYLNSVRDRASDLKIVKDAWARPVVYKLEEA